jgi:uncharacterized protein YqfB (UPF0267 family)
MKNIFKKTEFMSAKDDSIVKYVCLESIPDTKYCVLGILFYRPQDFDFTNEYLMTQERMIIDKISYAIPNIENGKRQLFATIYEAIDAFNNGIY